jgi:flavorubredoxin
MARALILYYSQFGHTKDIAINLAKGIKDSGVEADCKSIDEVDTKEILNHDLIAFGSPTHHRGISKPMATFLREMNNLDINGEKAFAFDTGYGTLLSGSAGKGIEKELRKLGFSIVQPYSSAIVKGHEGPLVEGMREKFQQIGIKIGESIR